MKKMSGWRMHGGVLAFWLVTVLGSAQLCVGQKAAGLASSTVGSQQKVRFPDVLSGKVPKTVAQMLAIQTQTQKQIEIISAVTVLIEAGSTRGSGVIVTTDRHVLTAAHVVGEPDSRVTIVLVDGRRMQATVLGVDREKDVALLQIDSQQVLPFAPIASSPSYAIGRWCLATGYSGSDATEFQADAFRSDHTTRPQVAVRLGRILDPRKYVVMTNCSLDRGDSGGPLFDMQGQVIGIHNRVLRTSEHSIHVSITYIHDKWAKLLRSENSEQANNHRSSSQR